MPLNDQCGISRKIEDPKERARLRKIIEKLSLPEGMGIIMRTVAEGKRARYFVRDLSILLEQWREIDGVRDTKSAPVCCLPGARSHRAHRARFPHRRNRRGRLRRPGDRGAHAADGGAHLAPRPAPHHALHRTRRHLRALRHPEADRRRLLPPGLAALRRLHRHRRNRGPHRHRRQHRPQQGLGERGQDPSSRPTSRPPTKSPASSACATSAASSSSTSST